MDACPICGRKVFQQDAEKGYCPDCHAFTARCSVGICTETPAVVAGNIALCKPHADEIGLTA